MRILLEGNGVFLNFDIFQRRVIGGGAGHPPLSNYFITTTNKK